MSGEEIARLMIERAVQIEREAEGRALTDDEARTLRSVAFLRQIAPYLFPPAIREGQG